MRGNQLNVYQKMIILPNPSSEHISLNDMFELKHNICKSSIVVGLCVVKERPRKVLSIVSNSNSNKFVQFLFWFNAFKSIVFKRCYKLYKFLESGDLWSHECDLNRSYLIVLFHSQRHSWRPYKHTFISATMTYGISKCARI